MLLSKRTLWPLVTAKKGKPEAPLLNTLSDLKRDNSTWMAVLNGSFVFHGVGLHTTTSHAMTTAT